MRQNIVMHMSVRNSSGCANFKRLLFYNNLVLPILDYADIVWGDKDNVTLMNDLQILQNKAAKIILDRPLHSSATDARATLRWLDLQQRRFYHRCLYVYKCVDDLMDHSMKLLTNANVHNYRTRNSDKLYTNTFMT